MLYVERVTFQTTPPVSTPITGRELLQLVKDFSEDNATALAIRAGYTRKHRKTGETIANTAAFKDALLAAKGVTIASDTKGRAAQNETTVHAAGGILIGSIYSKMAGVGPGDTYSITVNAETSQIVLDVIERVEGSPLPFRVYDRAKKATAAAPAETGEGGAETTGEAPTA